MSSAQPRLSRDCSMYLAGRQIDVSNCTPDRPGCKRLDRGVDSFRHLGVFASGNFSTTSRRHGPSLDRASPISG